MRCEIPVLQRCCFCFPLRYGLLVWAYIKQICSLLFLAMIIAALYFEYQRRHSISRAIELPILLIVTILDIAFHILFIISAHTKDYRKMRIFYRYSVVLLCLNVVVVCLFLAHGIYYIYMSPYFSFYHWTLILPSLCMTLILLLCQAYLIVLVRSEFLKLKNNSQFEFVNNAAEVRCTGNLDFDNDIPV